MTESTHNPPDQNTRQRNRRLLKRLFFALIAALIVLGGAEAVVRVGGWGVLPEERLFSDVYDAAYEMLPGAANPWTPVQEYLNKNGLRGQEFTKPRPKNMARVICLGDSTTFGVGVKMEQTYATRLVILLHARGVPVQALNAGMPGTNLWQQVLLYERRLAQNRPDLLIAYTAPNMRRDLFEVRRAIEDRTWGLAARNRLARLHLYRFLRSRIRPPRMEEMYSQYPILDPEHTASTAPVEWVVKDAKKDWERLKSLCARDGARLLAMSVLPRDVVLDARAAGLHSTSPEWPEFFRNHSFHADAHELAPDIAIDWVRGAGVFLDASYDRDLYIDDIHFSAAGHDLFAQILVREICDRNLLPKFPCIPADSKEEAP